MAKRLPHSARPHALWLASVNEPLASSCSQFVYVRSEPSDTRTKSTTTFFLATIFSLSLSLSAFAPALLLLALLRASNPAFEISSFLLAFFVVSAGSLFHRFISFERPATFCSYALPFHREDYPFMIAERAVTRRIVELLIFFLANFTGSDRRRVFSFVLIDMVGDATEGLPIMDDQ